MSGWESTDGLVIAAVGGHGRPCSLVEVIAATDRINHLIPSEDQLEGALGRLAGAGLLRVFEGWTFELTDDGMMVWSDLDGDLAARLKEVERHLTNFQPGTGSVELPRDAMKNAVEEYQSW